MIASWAGRYLPSLHSEHASEADTAEVVANETDPSSFSPTAAR
jgi:hypothetical protein